MGYEVETLKLLRQSLNEEDDEVSIISVLEHHHKYLKEYISILTAPDTEPEHKQTTLSLFLIVFTMHAKAEQDIFYHLIKNATNRDLRLEALKAFDEHEIAFEIIQELKDLNVAKSWSDEIDAKIILLTRLIKGHIAEEKNVLYPMAKRFIPESRLMDLTDDYLEKCKMYLDSVMETTPSEVSRNDVMTFLY